MPCTARLRNEEQTFAERVAEVESALKRLERYLQTGAVKLKIGPSGAVTFVGWQDRDDISDTCAVRSLMAQGSAAFRQALVRAEAVQGRKMNPQAVAAGVHSHDGGKTWSKH